MSAENGWITRVLERFRLAQVAGSVGKLDLYRSLIHRSRLTEKMHDVCIAVNCEAGRSILYERWFIPPHRRICEYEFEKNGTQYRMSVTVLDAGPTLVFSSHRRHQAPSRIGRLCARVLHRSPSALHFGFVFDPLTVSNHDLEQWFTYLLSGLRRSLKPAVKPRPPPDEF